jgi:hypothetical protein
MLTMPALSGLFVACGNAGDEAGPAARATPAPAKSAGAPNEAPALKFAVAARTTGTIYLLAGPDPASQDVYRIDGDWSKAERLTSSPLNFGISSIAANRDRVVVATGLQGADRIEQLRSNREPSPLPGIAIDAGSDPALDSTDSLAYVVTGRRGDRVFSQLKVQPPGGGKAARRLQRTLLASPVFTRRGRLTVLAGPAGRTRLVLDPGRANSVTRRLVHPRPTTLVADRRGRIAHLVYRKRLAPQLEQGGRLRLKGAELAILRPDGRLQRLFKLDWFPLAWSPDGRRLLVASTSDRRIGLLNPRTGRVRSIGEIDGVVGEADWIP